MKSIDALKGISIIAVILYHLGIVKTGYLGVDVFFVINGFLIIPSVLKKVHNEEFSCKGFLIKRIMRLFPLLLLGCAVSIVVGFLVMLPDDYENLSQSVVASVFFSNNLLAAITTKNYWNVVNEYKPLMHTWYLGIIVEFYIILICVILLSRFLAKITKKNFQVRYIEGIMLILTIISLILYYIPSISVGNKFYLIFFRFFELALGGFVGINLDRIKRNKVLGNRYFSIGVIVLLIVVVFSSVFSGSGFGTQVTPIGAEVVNQRVSFLPSEVLLIVTVLLSCIAVSANEEMFRKGVLTYLGKRSYSLFIWHQIIIAFYRYIVSKEVTIYVFFLYIATVLLISELSYRYVEKIRIDTKKCIATAGVACLTTIVSLIIYIQAGVVRDIPELNVSKNNVHRGMHAQYVERIYTYDVDFEENNDKINVLVVGNSFARDWANVLLESEMAEKINLSYSFDYYDTNSFIERIQDCDYLFSFSSKENIPDFVWKNISEESEVWGIGTKNFGESNGIIYSKRFADNYFEQCIDLDKSYESLNEKWKDSWGDYYIDMIGYVKDSNGKVRVFTPENKFISQDCAHLTQMGAQYYASMIDFNDIFK